MRILIAPNAFKHSLGPVQAAHSIASGLRASGLEADLVLCPIADGGNGTLEALQAVGGQRITISAQDPLGRPIQADYVWRAQQRTAIIEMAQASGLERLAHAERAPLRASSFGTGQMMLHALAQGAQRILLAVGGSATVDGGAGLLQALGLSYHDEQGQTLHQHAAFEQLAQVRGLAELWERWQACDVLIASDVNNPALGEQGAASVFGPQKGASQADVAQLEALLERWFRVAAQTTGRDVAREAGTGAAGALAGGLLAYLPKVQLMAGAALVLHEVGFEAYLADADLLITGEGLLDDQSLYGKAPIAAARLAQAHGVPTIALVGGLRGDERRWREVGIIAAWPIVAGIETLDEALYHAAERLYAAARRLGWTLQVGG